MTPLDYGRSFLIGKGSNNEVRFWIESRTRVIDETGGNREDFYQTASCKSENTFREKDLFQQENYDYLPIFSARFGLIFRRHARLSDRYRETRAYEEMFGGYALHVVEGGRIRELPTNAPHFADFVIEAPTPVDPENSDLKVHHYSKIVSVPARNRLFAVD